MLQASFVSEINQRLKSCSGEYSDDYLTWDWDSIAHEQKLSVCDLFEFLLDSQLFDKNQAYKLFAAAEGLSREDAVGFLMKMLKKRHPVLRGLAARSLGNLHEEKAAPELADILDHTYTEHPQWLKYNDGLAITEYAYMIDALGKIGVSTMGSLSVVAKIGKHCQDSNLRNHARAAFEKLAKKI